MTRGKFMHYLKQGVLAFSLGGMVGLGLYYGAEAYRSTRGPFSIKSAETVPAKHPITLRMPADLASLDSLLEEAQLTEDEMLRDEEGPYRRVTFERGPYQFQVFDRVPIDHRPDRYRVLDKEGNTITIQSHEADFPNIANHYIGAEYRHKLGVQEL